MKSSIAFAMASAISAGISYLTTPIFTRIMTPSDYGVVSLFLTWQSLFGIIAMFSLNYGVFNNGMMDYEDDRDRFSFSILILSNIITVILFIGLLSFKEYIVIYTGVPFSLISVMFLVFMLQPAYNFWIARQRYELLYKKPLLISVIIAILPAGVSILSVYYLEDKVFARIFGLELPLCMVYLFFYFLICKNAYLKINVSYIKEALLFNLPLLPHYLSVYVLSSSDRIMIANLVNNAAVGFYSIAYAISSICLLLWTAVNGSLVPYTYNKIRNNDITSLKKSVNILMITVASFCICIILIAPEIFDVVAPKAYHEGKYVIPAIVGGIFFQTQYSIYANVLYYVRKPKFVMVASLTAALLNILLNYIFIPRFGYIAAGYTTLFCYFLQATLDYMAVKYSGYSNVYDMNTIICISIVIIIVSILSNKLYDFCMLRYIVLSSFIFIIMWFFRGLMARRGYCK